MGVVKNVDLPTLYRLWNDHDLTRVQVSEMLRISPTHLTRLVARHKLPPRPRDRNQKTVDPTPEEIAARAAECRAARTLADSPSRVEVMRYVFDGRDATFSPHA